MTRLQAPLLEATALLAGASGRDTRVRAYALRSLTTASKPEEVGAIWCHVNFH